MLKSINEIFKEFLADKKKELSGRVYLNYENATGMMMHSFDGYGYMYLDDAQEALFEQKNIQGETFCNLFGAEVLSDSLLSEFLGYFLPKKVAIARDGANRIRGATISFYKWLVDKGYVADDNPVETVRYLKESFREGWEEFNPSCNEDILF